MKHQNNLSTCIAIPTFNREKVLLDTIKQVLSLTPLADEVIVIDQTMEQEHETQTIEYLSAWEKTNQIIWLRQSPPNLPAARNRAIGETKCDILIFIDDDVELPVNFVENHRKNYFDPNVIAVAGRVIQPGTSVKARPAWPRIMDHRFFQLCGEMRVEGIATLRGCNHSVRVQSLNEIGGYDTNYIGWAYREDSDVAVRLWKLGGVIVFDPDSWLKHLAEPTGGCRLKVKDELLPEWQISFPASYFALRHLFPNRWFWYDLLFGNVRRYIFRKDNVYRPWRLPWALISYTYAFFLSLFPAYKFKKNLTQDICLRSKKITSKNSI